MTGKYKVKFIPHTKGNKCEYYYDSLEEARKLAKWLKRHDRIVIVVVADHKKEDRKID